jgi:HK97 family phage major capsid protein
MSMKLFELKQQHKHALDKSDSILRAAEQAGRELTASESMDLSNNGKALDALGHEIRAIEKKNTVLGKFTARGFFDDPSLLASHEGGRSFRQTERVQLTEDYVNAFHDYVRSNGQNSASAALYEGAGSAGGYVVPSIVDQQIVPLAPTDMACEQSQASFQPQWT